MQSWTPEHTRFVGRIIFANFLNLRLKNYKSIIEEVTRRPVFRQLSRAGSGCSRKRAAIIIRRLAESNTSDVARGKMSLTVVARIATWLRRPAYVGAGGRASGREEEFVIRYTFEGFNRMYIIDKGLPNELWTDRAIRSMLFRLRRITSRNALTHLLLQGIIECQGKYLRSGDPIDLAPLSQVDLAGWMNRTRNWRPAQDGSLNSAISSRPFAICNSWLSRLANGISVIIPSGEEKPLKWFFQTRKDINKRLIKQLLDKENKDLQSGRLRKPYTDNKLRTMLPALLQENHCERIAHRVARIDKKLSAKRGTLSADKISRHSIGHYRKEMGIPPAGRRLSGYKYPPLSANFSMLYPLVLEEVLKCAPASPGIYEFRLKGREIAYPDGKAQVIYIGSTRNIRKRLREHLGNNSKNGHIKDFLKKHECSFRYIQFSKNWQEAESRLYRLFVTTYGAAPRCNRVKP